MDRMNDAANSSYNLMAMRNSTFQPTPRSFGMHAVTPPSTDPTFVVQRTDEVNTIQRMLGDMHASAVVITGTPGAGKSTLAALLYRRFQIAREAGLPAPRYSVWLTLGNYTTLSDIIASILSAINVKISGLYLLQQEQQIELLLQALRRPAENAFIVLDQFELLLQPETSQETAKQNMLPRFLEMLQSNLGSSRFLLTAHVSPYEEKNSIGSAQALVRSYMVSRISIPEGIALLQLRGVLASHEELSLVWQRCAGHALALTLFGALINLSGISLSYLLYAPDYQSLWSGDVTLHLIAALYHSLNPIQVALLRALCLFREPVLLQGLLMTTAGGAPSAKLELELGVLVRYAVVQQIMNTSGVACFILHPLLRQYVTEHYLEGQDHPAARDLNTPDWQLPLNQQPGGNDALQNALASAHMQVAIYYQHVMRTQCPPRAQRRELRDIEPIIAAVRHLCLGWRWQRACEMIFEEGLHEHMVQWGVWHALIGLYTALLPPFGVLLRKDEGLVSSMIAMLYGRMGELRLSQAYFERALAIQRQSGDTRGEASILTNQGELLRMSGERELARRNFGRALALNDRLHDPELTCTLLHNLGLLFYEDQQYQEAFHHYIQAWQLAESRQMQQHKGMILTNTGFLLYEQGLHQEGLAVLLEALRLRQEIRDPAVSLLETFLDTLEQRMGTASYMQLCRAAMGIKQEVFSRFAAFDVRQ